MTTNNIQNNWSTIGTATVRWVGSTAVITSQTNVTSITRSSTGKYVVNFSIIFPDANYTTLASMSNTSIPNTQCTTFIDNLTAIPTTTTVNIATAGDAYYDQSIVTTVIIGL